MNSILQYTILTAVLFGFDMAWGQASTPGTQSSPRTSAPSNTASGSSATSNSADDDDCRKEVAKWQNEIKKINDELGAVDPNQNSNTARLDRKRQQKTALQGLINECRNRRSSDCKELTAQRNEITPKFPVQAQQRAINCYLADEGPDESDSFPRALEAGVYAFAGETPPSSPRKTCDLRGTKNSFKDEAKDFDRKIEDFDRKIDDVEKDMNDSVKKSMEKVADLEKKRVELQEKLEELMAESKTKDAEERQKIQENQTKIQQDIRQRQTELLRARQQADKADLELKKALLKANVQNESAIQRTCLIGVEKYKKERYALTPGGPRRGSLGAATQRGSAKRNDLQAAYDDCYKSQLEVRAEIIRNNANSQVEMAKVISDLEANISDLVESMKQQVQAYNDWIQRNQENLSKAQQQMLQKDLLLAQQIQQSQQNQQLEEARLKQRRHRLHQQLTGFHNGRGEVSEAEIDEAIEQYERLAKIHQDMRDARCQGAPDASDDAEAKQKLEKVRQKRREKQQTTQ
ncbi:MAG: hypothetical protein ACK5Y2_09705 [Bdellovibrionales bacterium]